MTVAAFWILLWWVEGSGECRQLSAARRCGSNARVVQKFSLGRKSLLVREILIDDTKRANNTITTVTNRVKILA
jgi:hypothetical protein